MQASPSSQMVLAQDVTEFQPYFVQIVSQLLEHRPLPLPPIYLQILPTLLQQGLWAAKSNQPALTRLIKAYISRGSADIIATQGVFHQVSTPPFSQYYNSLASSRPIPPCTPHEKIKVKNHRESTQAGCLSRC